VQGSQQASRGRAGGRRLHWPRQQVGQPWSALMAALKETREVFDRANQSVREAFKKAAA